MEIKFADTFFESLKILSNQERWYWKLWFLFRYDIPQFFSNVWSFRKALWAFRWYDWNHSMNMMKVSVQLMEKNFRHGNEEETSRNKKVYKMRRAIMIMENFIDDKFIELAEKELGKVINHDWNFNDSDNLFNETPEESAHNSKVFDRAREIEESMWKELWQIFEGQDYSKFTKIDTSTSSESYDNWVKQFNGDGLRGWWD